MGEKVRYTNDYGDKENGTVVGFVSIMNNNIVAIIRTNTGRYIQRSIENIENIEYNY